MLYELYGSPDVITEMKIPHLRWAEYVRRTLLKEYWKVSHKEEEELEDWRIDGVLQGVKCLKICYWWMSVYHYHHYC